jgi:hypothetical protein
MELKEKLKTQTEAREQFKEARKLKELREGRDRQGGSFVFLRIAPATPQSTTPQVRLCFLN